jgi:hypothetical protein
MIIGPVQIVHFIGTTGLDRICDIKPAHSCGKANDYGSQGAVICGKTTGVLTISYTMFPGKIAGSSWPITRIAPILGSPNEST